MLSKTQCLKVLLYTKRRQRRNNDFLYLVLGLIFESLTIHRSLWKKSGTQNLWIENVLQFWTNEGWIQISEWTEKRPLISVMKLKNSLKSQIQILGKQFL